MIERKVMLGILKNENPDSHLEWAAACENTGENISYKIIDITRTNWLEKVTDENFDILLTRPPDNTTLFKQLYDERLYIIHHILKIPIYPSYEELLIYENKKFLAYWLKANHIPHPKTHTFYHQDEAIEFSRSCTLPQVGKTSIGAAGSGVQILQTQKQLTDYIKQAFSPKGIPRRWGPNLRKGEYIKRLLKRLKNIPNTLHYFNQKFTSAHSDPLRQFAILQEYIPTDFEWRAVRIGNSFFAHKKLPRFGSMFSGTSNVSWDGPHEKLLDFVKTVTDKRGFLSQAVDTFEDKNGNLLVNELQSFFGSKNPHQMILNGKPGRYLHTDSGWSFEEGNFNTNNSYDLRLRHALELFLNKGIHGE